MKFLTERWSMWQSDTAGWMWIKTKAAQKEVITADKMLVALGGGPRLRAWS
jgi:hypothetical protein